MKSKLKAFCVAGLMPPTGVPAVHDYTTWQTFVQFVKPLTNWILFNPITIVIADFFTRYINGFFLQISLATLLILAVEFVLLYKNRNDIIRRKKTKRYIIILIVLYLLFFIVFIASNTIYRPFSLC